VIDFVIEAVIMTALAEIMLPARWRPSTSAARLVTAVAALASVVVADATGVLESLHEDVFNRVGGEFDELSTWLVATIGAVAALITARMVQRAVRRG
jgi:hypothetical protein